MRHLHAPDRFIPPTPTRGLKIGLLGGSFDPAHHGHRHVADVAFKRLGLDYVWWIPARGNPLKSTETPFPVRYASTVWASEHPRMAVTDIERRLSLRFTADLIRVLLRRCPETRFVWLMGGDNLRGFHRWQAWDDIARTLPIAVIARPGAGPRARLSKFAERFEQYRLPAYEARSLPGKSAPAWVHLRAPLNAESSTRLRALKKAG